MTVAFEIATSVEEELEALARSEWELGLVVTSGPAIDERRSVSPPPSYSLAKWDISEHCSVGAVTLWRDGKRIRTRSIASVRLRGGDTLTVHYSLSPA